MKSYWTDLNWFNSGYIELMLQELITAYAVQNPFMFGCYDLRREQLKMQLSGSAKTKPDAQVKEKYFFYPTTFSNLVSVGQLPA